ncbi:TIGR02281 family clan AA aspartic protease [Sphingosinicella rhizophila]|uniref:TIGR02281 family clan AA aspartic protease n=1 Tax=Sphingosinicella rhizophila TaxID=3050082 RepID=A0ABU3Q7H0_9SPHN|nr:TIGR02281 family clan AA aspartic protease [Sphingosinicella sp. GR2756]MDT9599346.1 TIGR02281 family clan AA aspartic protease [Sphingosinicella sp. GR2756]
MGGSNFLFGSLMLAGIAILGTQLGKPQATVSPLHPAVAEKPEAKRMLREVPGGLAIDRGADRHFYANALVNGVEIRFMIDTGASTIVLTGEDARRAGLGTGEYSARAIGAGGELRLMPVRLARLSAGPLVAESVPAMVAEQGRLPVSLLGQTFLDQFESVAIEGDTMILR